MDSVAPRPPPSEQRLRGRLGVYGWRYSDQDPRVPMLRTTDLDRLVTASATEELATHYGCHATHASMRFVLTNLHRSAKLSHRLCERGGSRAWRCAGCLGSPSRCPESRLLAMLRRKRPRRSPERWTTRADGPFPPSSFGFSPRTAKP